MTRANVIQVGLFVLLLGGLGYLAFKLIGFNDVSAGIAAEAVLIFVVLGWTGSYLFRVFTGNMTFMEQRKRYRKAYDKISNEELQASFDAMSKDEQIKLLNDLEKEQNDIKPQ